MTLKIKSETVDEEFCVENKISFPKFMITETNNYNIRKVFSGFHLLPKATKEIKIEETNEFTINIFNRVCFPVWYIHVHFKVQKLFALWKPWVRGIRDEDLRL